MAHISDPGKEMPSRSRYYAMSKGCRSLMRNGFKPYWLWLAFSFFWTLPSMAGKGNNPITTQTGFHALRLNELLPSNQHGLRDEQGNTSDWLEIFHSGTEQISLSDYSLTDDIHAPNKWEFPDHYLEPGDHLLVWMSGRQGQAMVSQLPDDGASHPTFSSTLIGADARWTYLYHPVADHAAIPEERLPEHWTKQDLAESGFAIGQGDFGYGDGNPSTPLPPGTTVALLRHAFTLDQPLASETLVLHMRYDDGFIAFLNGKKVLAVNAPAGNFSFKSRATQSHEGLVPELFDLSEHANILRPGTNILAIAGFNISSSSSDFVIHPSLGTLRPVYHANFTLKRKGGNLYLMGPENKIVDQVHYPRQVPDQSFGRATSDSMRWGYFFNPTPGASNTGPIQESPSEAPSVFPEPGTFPNSIQVEMQSNASPEFHMRYTLDGSDPNPTSAPYLEPLHLEKTTFLRAAVFAGTQQLSPSLSATYLIRQRTALPVISLSMRSSHFREVHLNKNASGPASERPAFLEFFDGHGMRKASMGVGLRLHGGAGRNGNLKTKKSYRAYVRKSYGPSRLGADFIPEADIGGFDKLVFRASSNDRAPHGSSLRDQMIRDLHADMGGLASKGSWCVLFINGNRRGVYNVTERMDETFLASHLGDGSYDVMKTGETLLSGTREGWDTLRSFVDTADFSKEINYRKLAQRVDIENLTSYVILNMCLLNFDWPHNNWYAARRVPEGKWFFLCWDAEWALGYRHPGLGDAPYGVNVDPYAFMDSGGAYGHSLIRSLFLALITNPDYCAYYQEEVKRHLKGALSTENILKHLQRHRDSVAQDIESEYQAMGQDIGRWHQQLAEVEHFATNSPRYFQDYTDAYFNFKPSAADRNRLAIYPGHDGSHYAIYRDPTGPLREVAFTAEGSTRYHRFIPLPEFAPAADGSPCVYTGIAGRRHVMYRDTHGNLHEVSAPAEPQGTSPWHHRNLSDHLHLTPAMSDPCAVMVNGVPHVVYIDQQSRPHELWLDRTWHHHPLPSTPRPGGAIGIFASPGSIHVTYPTMYGVPCEQTLVLNDASANQRPWRHRLIQRIPCEGTPLRLQLNGAWRLIFRPAERWPGNEPFIFHWNNATRTGYREYRGTRLGLIEARSQNQRFDHLESIGHPDLPARGNPTLLHDTQRNRHYIAYRDTAGHIQEATWIDTKTSTLEPGSESKGWKLRDITQLAGCPPASGEPAGNLMKSSDHRFYLYRGNDGKLHRIHFDGTWTHIVIPAVQMDTQVP
ncbi:MAG: CotH kinase family protein [Verrucomicrobiota bacterium]|nr:CotH kinase family protein [Verrucomicrobiota bacterium]